jgi:hypothetical protein
MTRAIPALGLAAAAVTVAAGVWAVLGAAPQGPPPGLVAARQALGGEAALSAVTSFRATGRQQIHLSPMKLESTVEWLGALPDRFVEIRRSRVQRGPLGEVELTYINGFNGDAPIRESITPGMPPPPVIPQPRPSNPDAAAAARAGEARLRQRTFVQIALPLFAASFSGAPLILAAVEPGSTEAITATDRDGRVWTLVFDGSTALPLELRRRDRPVAVATRTSTVTMDARDAASSPMVLLPRDPTAGMPDVDWVTTVADFRSVGSLHWPHRFTTTVDGQPYEDVTISRYWINPRIDEDRFAPTR